MKSVVVYESIYGNTAAIAEAIASGLRAHGDVDVRAVGDEPAVADLLVVGAPTHAHGLPTTMSRKAIVAAVEEAEGKGTPLDYNPTSGMRALLDRLPKVEAGRAACFDTRFDMARLLTGSAANTMARKMRHLGYEIVVEPESFFVDDTEGPLKEGELKRATQWGAGLLS
jgi:Flavodoxin domain